MEIQFYKVNKNGLLANFKLTSADLWIKGKIVQGKEGPYVSFPSVKGLDKEGQEKWYAECGIAGDVERFKKATSWIIAQAFAQNIIEEKPQAPLPEKKEDTIPW